MSTLNPDAYQAVFDALKAIVAYDTPLRAGLLNQATDALHMAQLPVKLTDAGERVAPIQGDPPCDEYDESGEGAGIEFDGFSQCANCGHAKSFHKLLPVVPAEELLGDFTVSFWLQDALRSARQRDPVDAVRDAELLLGALRLHLEVNR